MTDEEVLGDGVAPDDLNSIRSQLAGKRTELQNVKDDFARIQDSKSRTALAKIIIYAFVAMIAALFAYAFVLSFFTCETCTGEVPKILTFLGEFTASVMLPVVTLVLGYYFGTKQNGGDA